MLTTTLYRSIGVASPAPVLSSPTAGTATSGGSTGAGVTTDTGNGTLYWAVVTNGGSCTDAQLKAGAGGNIVAGVAGSQAVSGTGAQTIANITGLSASTTYQIKFLQTSGAAVDSSQASVSLTTAAASFSVDSAQFDGTNDYMTRGAALTGIADGKKGILSVWIRIDGGDGTNRNILVSQGLNGKLNLTLSSSNVFDLQARNAADTRILRLLSSNTYTAGATWRNILASWDLGTAGARWLYVTDVDDTSVATFTNDTIAYTTPTNWAVGADTGGSGKLNACLAEFYLNTAESLDLSVTANRRKFIGATGKAINLGVDGSTPTGTAPIAYFHLAAAETPADFATNRGTGGNFTITGTLTTGSSAPSY
jgi:hypothetical protein